MTEENRVGPTRPDGSDLESLRASWLCLTCMGITLMVVGLVGISSSLITTIATVVVFGVLLLVGAVCQIANAFWARQWRGFFLHLLAGVLYFIAGLFMIEHPVGTALGLTLMLAACLLVGGILRIIVSVAERFEGWGWVLLCGCVSVLLGAAIWRQWPLSGFEVIGLLVGIEFLFSGVSWVMLGLAARGTPARTQPT